jgi:hypothetical protein
MGADRQRQKKARVVWNGNSASSSVPNPVPKSALIDGFALSLADQFPFNYFSVFILLLLLIFNIFLLFVLLLKKVEI